MIKIIIALGAFFALTLITGCSQRAQAINQMVSEYLFSKDINRFDSTPLQPQFQYLEVHSNTAQALMVLGYVESAGPDQPLIHTWYSGDYEFFRTQGGRLLDVSGVTPSQRNTQLHWQYTRQGIPLATHKTFDQPELQVFNYSETLTANLVTHNQIQFATPLQRRLQANAHQWVWVIESRSGAMAHLPASLYAYTQTGQPVYGRECLTTTQCFEWLYRKNEQ